MRHVDVMIKRVVPEDIPEDITDVLLDRPDLNIAVVDELDLDLPVLLSRQVDRRTQTVDIVLLHVERPKNHRRVVELQVHRHLHGLWLRRDF
eukprot:CAMPEP_0168338612 /NCGR_PEP_ID=MMETSP0213-20121227/12950_1 /TAXON_ID=151035 /ORGANISM="Euplotes harpa, Strain FSP1.4" /LENGTH=91 /DNA_ID=CAMNT_0008344447 /DNA_START=258 /DNA_END=533 /DNA_ORIENTATION=+